MSLISLALGLAVLASSWKYLLLSKNAFPFNADEAIVALMGRHILEGDWPLFFYGQAYMGSLDATLVALAFRLLGAQIQSIRTVQILLYAGTILTTVYLSYAVYRSKLAAGVAGLVLAIPTLNATLYTTVSLGGYGEVLLLGNLLLLLALHIARPPLPHPIFLVLWGLCAGLAFWAFALSLVYILPSGYVVVKTILASRNARARSRNTTLLLLCALLGSSPWWLGVWESGLGLLLQEMLGSAISGIGGGPAWLSPIEHARNLLLFGVSVIFGLRAPWSVEPVFLPLLPVALLFWIAVLGFSIARFQMQDGARIGRRLSWGVVLTLLAGFLFLPFGADPSGRYFIPLVLPFALFAGEAVDFAVDRMSWILPIGGLALLILHNLLGTCRAAQDLPRGITTQFDPITQIDHSYVADLIEFLELQGATRGFSNYWVSYPLAFLSEENLIFVPRLPYHQDFRYTARDDRYPPYTESVVAASSVAYVTTKHPELDAKIRDELDGQGITWREERIGDYQVFYQLSKRVEPWILGIGKEIP